MTVATGIVFVTAMLHTMYVHYCFDGIKAVQLCPVSTGSHQAKITRSSWTSPTTPKIFKRRSSDTSSKPPQPPQTPTWSTPCKVTCGVAAILAGGTKGSNELIAEQKDISLTEGSNESLTCFGTSGGRQNTPLEEHLSDLIDALNERLEMTLSDSDRIWFQQQAFSEEGDVRQAAQGNDLQQFGVFVLPRMDELIVNRHGAHDELFRAYSDKTEFKNSMVESLVKSLYENLRDAE